MTGHLNFVFTFQLTPSRRATDTPACALRNFDISTHALTEGDLYFFGSSESVCVFQLTPSRRATKTREEVEKRRKISTHALTEGDSWHQS